jgi:hypothetical protein
VLFELFAGGGARLLKARRVDCRAELTLPFPFFLSSPFRLPYSLSQTSSRPSYLQAEAYKRDDPPKSLKQESLNEAHRKVLDKEVKGGAAGARGV